MDWLTDPQVWMALVTLTALEIVLGIDNIIFISIQAGKLPAEEQEKARLIGLGLAMFVRVALLFSLSWLMGLTKPLFTLLANEISGRDLILLSGGMFLLWKSTMEIHEKLEGENGQVSFGKVGVTFSSVIVQILLLDIVFSLDSIITALGMANQLSVMVAAVVIAVFFMMLFAGKISVFVEKHPTIKMLALSFLLLIGVALIG
ncbi:MAG: TerC family protein, partial [Desulfobulbaceae bacterium]|nr:TerC family protein [Desulfobulbaceae bacterium]